MDATHAHAVAEPRQRVWNWTFWAVILAFEVLGVLLTRQT